MNAMERMGLALGITALLSAAGCSGSGGAGMMAAKAPSGSYNAPSYAGAESVAPESPASADEATGYEPPPPEVRASATRGEGAFKDAEPMQRREAGERPGLGTEWGETRFSRITSVPFIRASSSSPFASAALFYNDAEGADAMASMASFQRTAGRPIPHAGGLVSIGLRDEGGRFLSGFVAGGRNYILGEAGRRYSIVVRNNTESRLEVVLSVDGLDVIDGKDASFSKRGYLVDARSEIEVEGFRQSADAVAAFRFGSVRNSYANQKHGNTRNVGVIGIAIFNERGSSPVPWTPDEVQRRLDADPFPGQFATPPGR